MGSLPTCLINLFVVFLKVSSNPNPLFTLLLRNGLFLSPFTGSHSLQIRTQITRLCNAAYPHLKFDLSFVHLHASPLSFLFRIKFPNFWILVLYTYLSVDAVPRRMWVKTLVIYTPGCQNIWESLLRQEDHHPVQSCPAFSPVFKNIRIREKTSVFKNIRIRVDGA